MSSGSPNPLLTTHRKMPPNYFLPYCARIYLPLADVALAKWMDVATCGSDKVPDADGDERPVDAWQAGHCRHRSLQTIRLWLGPCNGNALGNNKTWHGVGDEVGNRIPGKASLLWRQESHHCQQNLPGRLRHRLNLTPGGTAAAKKCLTNIIIWPELLKIYMTSWYSKLVVFQGLSTKSMTITHSKYFRVIKSNNLIWVWQVSKSAQRIL